MQIHDREEMRGIIIIAAPIMQIPAPTQSRKSGF